MSTARINPSALALLTTIEHLTGKFQFSPPKGLGLSRQNRRITLTVSSMAAAVSDPLEVKCIVFMHLLVSGCGEDDVLLPHGRLDEAIHQRQKEQNPSSDLTDRTSTATTKATSTTMLTVTINPSASALSTTIKHLTGKLQFSPPKGLGLSRQNKRITLTVSSMAATVSDPLEVCVKASVTTPNRLGDWFNRYPNVAFSRKTKNGEIDVLGELIKSRDQDTSPSEGR
ncbi:hypothetical protein Vadar_030323 [Vaccinium darrowii]|uniref:Uncharacterized protein n=1 Tax=Vaccinium darrowii TaxID=229202 RepID=A0ACB7YZQ6_9ERIC|nr:hypothetical protein Vadar_030323 [Vaccinium darrowii]